MQIAYILFTTNNENTECQKQTFLKYVNESDIYYISRTTTTTTNDLSNPNEQYNLLTFMRNITIHYDWYYFINEDTFCYPNRLESFLEKNQYDTKSSYYIGKMIDTNASCDIYMSINYGILLSHSLYIQIENYVRTNATVLFNEHIDYCIGSWVNHISKQNTLFSIDYSINDIETVNNIPKYISYYIQKEPNYIEQYMILNERLTYETTAITMVTDENYFHRAKSTICELTNNGKWKGDIVLITVDFDLPQEYKSNHNIIEAKFPKIDTNFLIEQIGPNGFKNGDGREFTKLTQWEKLHVFDDYFMKWKRIIFMDAGLRVFDSIDYLLELDFKDRFLCPNDAGDGPVKSNNRFITQLDVTNVEKMKELTTVYGNAILTKYHFLNCIWIYDTTILRFLKKQEFIDTMNTYPICKTNEMGVMNIVLNYKYNLWKQFPWKASNYKFLFDWTNRDGRPCSDYCFIKYESYYQ